MKETLEAVSGVEAGTEEVLELLAGGVVREELGMAVEEKLAPSRHSNSRKMTPPTVRFSADRN